MSNIKIGYIAIIFIFLVLGILYFFRGAISKILNPINPIDETVEIEYWGLFLPEQVMDPLIKKYELENPNVKINYRERNFNNDLSDYKDTLKTRLRDGTGPDIFRMHSTWYVPFSSELSSQNDIMDAENFNNNFYPIASTGCTDRSGSVHCIPLMYDGLVLLYNLDIFKESGLSPPKTWEELKYIASKLTKEEGRQLSQAGVAMGSSSNVSNASDILTLIMLQNSVNLPDGLDKQDAKNSLAFYQSFVREGIWDEKMPQSTLSFATEKVAMVFVKQWEILEILEVNSTLKFGVSPVPQVPKLDGTTTNKTWASYWVEAVSNDASDETQKEAWKFIAWLSEPEQQKMLFKESSKYYKFGEVYSHVELKNDLINTPLLGPFITQAPNATTWSTADMSGNDEYIEIMDNLIENKTNLKGAKSDLIKQMKKDGYR